MFVYIWYQDFRLGFLFHFFFILFFYVSFFLFGLCLSVFLFVNLHAVSGITFYTYLLSYFLSPSVFVYVYSVWCTCSWLTLSSELHITIHTVCLFIDVYVYVCMRVDSRHVLFTACAYLHLICFDYILITFCFGACCFLVTCHVRSLFSPVYFYLIKVLGLFSHFM